MADLRCLLLTVSTIFLTLSCADQLFTRKLNTKILCPLLPGCSSLENDSYVNVAYTRADGINDTLHYVYSSFGAPTVLVAKTSRESELHFNLSQFVSENLTDRIGSLNFTDGMPGSVLALVFTQLIEFNDVGDTGKLPSNRTLWHTHDLSNGIWEDSSKGSDIKKDVVEFRMLLRENSSIPLNQSGRVVFKFQAFKDNGMNSQLPHLHYNANITQVYVTLENIATTFPNPRFSLAMTTVTVKRSDNMTINDVKSIDDETTPGAFHTINWVSSSSSSSSSDSIYLQWKPLCYTDRDMKISNARYTYFYGPSEARLGARANLAESYFGDLKDVKADETFISFGETDDKFYTATNYSAWALSIGYGTPPMETISLMVILIISIGLGIPLILIVIGGTYVIVRRYRSRRSAGYEDLTSSYPPIGT